MARGSRSVSLAVLTLLCAACAGQEMRRFWHTLHRVNHGLEEAELASLRFYVSTDVLVQADADETATGRRSILVTRGTPGVVSAVGPNWLRVRFSEGGPGVVFAADPDNKMDGYSLATLVEGRRGYQKVQDLEQKVVHQDGVAYRVVYGATAYLLADMDRLQELIDQRSLEGLRVK